MKTLPLICNCVFLFCINASAQTWNSLGQGLNDWVIDLTVHHGDLYAVGKFTNAGGDPDADYIARWDGSEWRAVAPGLNKEVKAIAFSGDTIYAGGSFTEAGGVPGTRHIAYWDGTKWNPMEQGLNGDVSTIAIKGNEVFAGGSFKDLEPGGPMNYIARWDGNNWNAMGNGFENKVLSIVVDGSDIYAGGGDAYTGGLLDEQYILKWSGHSWLIPGNGLAGVVTKIRRANAKIYASGLFEGNVASWNNIDWTNYRLPSVWGEIMDIAISGEEIFAVGWDEGVYHRKDNNWNLILDAGNVLPDDFGTILINDNDLYLGGIFNLILPGTQNIATWENSITTSSEDENKPSHALIKIFPTPSDDMIYFDLENWKEEELSLTLTDASGQKMIARKTCERVLDISNLPSGVYILHIRNQEKFGVEKVVKQ